MTTETALSVSVVEAINFVRVRRPDIESTLMAIEDNGVMHPNAHEKTESSYSNMGSGKKNMTSTGTNTDTRNDFTASDSDCFRPPRLSSATAQSEWRLKLEEAERATESAQNKLRQQRREAARRERSLREGLAEANAALQQVRNEAEAVRKELAQASSTAVTATDQQHKQRNRERALRQSTEELRVSASSCTSLSGLQLVFKRNCFHRTHRTIW